MYRHWQPVLRMYITPFMTARMSTTRLPPPRLAGGITARHMPIRHQSGRSDISSDRGRTSPGSCPSTMEAPPSNQVGLHRIQVIQRTQEVFGRTLRCDLARENVKHIRDLQRDHVVALFFEIFRKTPQTRFEFDA